MPYTTERSRVSVYIRDSNSKWAIKTSQDETKQDWNDFERPNTSLKITSHRRCQGHCLNACKMLFHRLIAAFHQHLASLFPSELATVQVTASTWLLQLIRISKMWSDQKQSLKRNHVPPKSADAVARNGAPISNPSYILLISEDVFLSLINAPLQKRFVMHYSCCTQPERACTTGCSDGCAGDICFPIGASTLTACGNIWFSHETFIRMTVSDVTRPPSQMLSLI